MRYPPNFIERLKHHFPISEVIGKRISIRRHGREFHALCPFHKEKSPSFTINDEKGFYHCFGCGAHGDAIGFVKEYENLTYREAIEKLAAEAGLPLPEFSAQDRARAAREATLYDVMEQAARWFMVQLMAPHGRDALNYLRSRGITPQTQSLFRLGFAPAARDGLKRALMAMNISEAQLIEAGLLTVPEDKGPGYDKFRNRAIFPIADSQGRVIAFGGRIMDTEARGPKYLNSPETPLFKKGETLYNFHMARRPAHNAKSVIVGEGYMDVIALHHAGFEHAVAALGTAITPDHLQQLWRLTSEPVLCLDGDEAGLRAMRKAGETALPLLKPGQSLNFALLPKGEDPDTLIRTHGRPAMVDALKNAWPLSRVLWEGQAMDLSTPEKKAAAEQRLMELSDRIADATVKNHYRAYFKEKLWSHGRLPRAQKRSSPLLSSHLATALPGRTAQMRGEKQMMALVLHYAPLLEHANVEEAFARIEMLDHAFEPLHEALLEAAHSLDYVTSEALTAFLSARGLSDQAFALLADDSIGLPRSVKESAEHGDEAALLAVWQQVVGACTIARIEVEYQQAVAQLSAEQTEAAMAKCSELQRELEQTRRQMTSGFYGTGAD